MAHIFGRKMKNTCFMWQNVREKSVVAKNVEKYAEKYFKNVEKQAQKYRKIREKWFHTGTCRF